MPSDVELTGNVGEFFEPLANNGGLTEEYLYEHQPTSDKVAFVYSTSHNPVGRIDVSLAEQAEMSVLNGPVIVVARKGYAGRMFVASEAHIVVHEDAYAIAPKPEYAEKIMLDWFAEHFSVEFQSYRTAEDGIGDFPRSLLLSRRVSIPSLTVQKRHAALYRRRRELFSAFAQRVSKMRDAINLSGEAAGTMGNSLVD